MGSVSQIGWHWYARLARRLPVTLVTHVRNREALTENPDFRTRLLIREAGLWKPFTYLWDEAEEEATLIKVGKRINIDFIDLEGKPTTEEYIVPNLDQCASCHERDDKDELLGLVTHQLNIEVDVDGQKVNQLEWLASKGMFSGTLPDVKTLPGFVDPFGSAPLEDRARSYLHANCSHCHRLGGGATNSGLVFLQWEETAAKYGVFPPR